jgi:hypothetical protein
MPGGKGPHRCSAEREAGKNRLPGGASPALSRYSYASYKCIHDMQHTMHSTNPEQHHRASPARRREVPRPLRVCRAHVHLVRAAACDLRLAKDACLASHVTASACHLPRPARRAPGPRANE